MKNKVILLLLGTLGSQSPDFNGLVTALSNQAQSNVESATNSNLKTTEGEKSTMLSTNLLEGKTLSEALSSTDLDLSSFEKLLS